MQGHIYTSPLSVEHNTPTPIYTELRNVHHHTSTHATPIVDRNVHHKYIAAYDHYRTEDYVYVSDMTNSLHNGTNQEEKRNMYKSSQPIPVHYQPSDAIEYAVNEKGVDVPTMRSHVHPSALPDIGSFFGPPQQRFHQKEMFTADKGVSTYGSEGALHPVRLAPRDMLMSSGGGPSFEEVGSPIKYQRIEEDIDPKLLGRHAKEIIFRNTQTHYGPSNGNRIDKNFSQAYTDLRALPMNSCIRHTETEKQKYVKFTSGRILMKSGAKIYRSRSVTAKPFHCPYCPKSFCQTANLKAHKRIHSGEKPFQCTVCNKKFTQSSSVKTHMRVHTGERPYACTDCGNTFADSSTLTKHKRVHSGDKPYQCRLCSQRFSQSGNLNRHIKVHNLKDRIVSC